MNQPSFEPESAISAARQGDATAVAALIEHYRPYLKLLARATLRKRLQHKFDESDLVQETSVLACRDLASFRGATEPELAAWLRTILSRVASNAGRFHAQQKRSLDLEQQLKSDLDRSSVSLSQMIGRESTPSEGAKRREDAVLLAEALEQLSDEQRAVLTMREVEGRSLAEIAEQFGKTRNAVQKIWAKAITEMRQILKDMP